MRSIQISEVVWNFLKQHAEPFTDTEDDVLRRLLKLPASETATTTSAGRTKQEAFRQAIKDALMTFENRMAHKDQVLAYIEQHFPLTDADKELEGKKQQPAWMAKVAWEASVMRHDEELLRRKRGIWELPSKFDTIPMAETA
jgi:hypothetical protein